MKSIIAWLIALFLCTGLLTGCSSFNTLLEEREHPVEKKVELVLMHYFSDEGAIRWIDITTNVFKMTHDGVVFNIKAVDSSDYTQLVRKKLASGDMPDIFMVENITDLKEFIDAGYVANLTGQNFIKNNIKEESITGAMLEGKIWCVPIETSALGVVYNRDVFAKAGIYHLPMTYSEFLADCEAIKKIGISPIGAPYANSKEIRNDFNCDMIQNALKYDHNWLVDIEEGRATWATDNAHFKEVLLRFGQRSRYINSDCFDTDWDKATAMLADGNVGMVINSTLTIDAARYKNSMANLGFFALPWSNNPSEVKLPLKTTGGFAINSRSPNLEMAVEVLKFFTHPKVGRIFQNLRRSISSVKGLDSVSDSALKDIEIYINKKNILDYSAYSPNFHEDKLNSLLDDVLGKFLVDGGSDADKYIRILDEETVKIIKSGK